MRLFFTLTGLFLTAGCFPKTVPVASDAALFCDVEQPRRFTRAEIDWRKANAPGNLTLDFQTNLTFERECSPAPE